MCARNLLVAIATTLSLTACGFDDAPPEDVGLAELAARPQAYDGRTVRTRGIVRGFDDPRHYWLEDPRINRVGLEPMDMIAPHLEREVTIVGRFSFSRDRGRRIAIDGIEAYDMAR
jgi:hypothetical protein